MENTKINELKMLQISQCLNGLDYKTSVSLNVLMMKRYNYATSQYNNHPDAQKMQLDCTNEINDEIKALLGIL